MNRRERKELALSKLVLLALAVLGLGIIVWLAWVWPSSRSSSIRTYEECVAAGNPVRTSHPPVCATEDGQLFVNGQSSGSPADEPNGTSSQTEPEESQQFLTIKEWRVRVPLGQASADMTYAFSQSDLGEHASFTFARLQQIVTCQTDAGVSMTRSGTQNQPPYTLGDPEPVAHAGSYYYYLAAAGSPCYDPDNPNHTKLVTDVTGGETLFNFIKQSLQKLQPIP